MDIFTHRQVAVVSSRNQDFLRVAEQERRAASAIAASARPRTWSGKGLLSMRPGLLQGPRAWFRNLAFARA